MSLKIFGQLFGLNQILEEILPDCVLLKKQFCIFQSRYKIFYRLKVWFSCINIYLVGRNLYSLYQKIVQMGQCNNCVRKQEIYKQPPTNRQNFDQIPNNSKKLPNKNIKNKQDSLAFPPGSTLNSKSGNPKNEVKIISENDSSQKTRAVQKKKRKVQEQDQLHINKKNLEEKQQKLNQSMINIQLQSQNDKKFTRQIFPQLQKTTQQSNMMKKLSIPQKRKIKSDPLPRYTLHADILKRKTTTSSLPLNRPQPKHLTQFISNDLDLRKTFIPIKNINNKILTNREKKQIGGLAVVNQTKNKPLIKTSIVEQSNKKFGPKISKISQIQVKNVDSPKEN